MEPYVYPREVAILASRTALPRGPGIAGSPDHLIRPGVGAGGVRIGMSEGQALRVLGAPDARDEQDGLVRIAWAGIEVLLIAGPGGRVIEVRVTDRGIRTAEGVGVGSTVPEVKATTDAPECEPGRIIRMTGDALPGDRVTTFRLGERRTVVSVEVGRILG